QSCMHNLSFSGLAFYGIFYVPMTMVEMRAQMILKDILHLRVSKTYNVGLSELFEIVLTSLFMKDACQDISAS
ncbi:11622_t:CDS:2, partial [Funneliformis mosseae]